MTASRTLAQHFASTAYDKLAGNRLHDMKRLLLDYCGVAISGSQADTGRLARQFVVDSGGAPQASVIGARARVPAANAAFANAVAEHSIELDDVDDEALFHYGPPVVSSALAVAEWKHANGRDLLTAMLAGCEMTNRLSLATNPELRNRGFHTTPTCGVFGATVAAGRLLGLDAEHMTSALGLAGTQACGLMEMYGPSMQKRINPGPAARNGVTAAALADIGFTGADTILDGERGFGAAFAGKLDLDALLGGLGQRIPVTVEYKPYSAARPIHNAIDCVLNLRSRGSIDLTMIERVVVYRHPTWAKYHLNGSPTTFHEAQVSLPYSVAIAFVEGSALPAQYLGEQLTRTDLTSLAQRVTVMSDAALPRGVSCRMVVTLADGTTLETQVDDPKGSVRNPMSDDELAAKFASLAGAVFGDARAEELAAAIWAIDSLTDTGRLTELLSSHDGRASGGT